MGQTIRKKRRKREREHKRQGVRQHLSSARELRA